MSKENSGPKHVAIIMDGNGRWAKARGRPRLDGHRAGLDAARGVAEAALEGTIEALTLYAFSQDNWDRPKQEVDGIFELLLESIDQSFSKLTESGAVIRFIGERESLPQSLQKSIATLEAQVNPASKLFLQIALNYSGRWDIVQAAQKASQLYGNITAKTLEQNLSTYGIPPLDLLIRTGGEERLSDYLLWQAAYAELYFTSKLWPDFAREDLYQALNAYSVRERRFGKTSEQL